MIVIIRQYSSSRFLLPYNQADLPTKRLFLNCTNVWLRWGITDGKVVSNPGLI